MGNSDSLMSNNHFAYWILIRKIIEELPLETEKKAEVILYGAFDRHNYGDLLFPLIMERVISRHFPNKKIEIAGLIDSDLSIYGAPKTVSIHKALKQSKDDAVIMLAGGDVVACDWQSAYGYLLPTFFFPFYERIACRFMPKITDTLVAKIAGLTSAMPFNLNQKDAGKNRKIIYNSVGATGVSRVEGSESEYLKKVMNEADFVSVRDTFSQDQLIRIGYEKPMLAPDSATVMSSVISINELNEKTSNSTIQLIDKLKKEYLVFQISQSHVKGKEVEFAKQLSIISKKKKLPILFIAIGNAAGHNDSVGINQVTSLLDQDVNFESYVGGNLFDIMNIIRNASCYCGTSLHGLITSMSFGVPRVGLLPSLRKQVNYMRTWDLEDMPRGIAPNELEDSVGIAMNFTRDELHTLGENLTSCYMENFKKLSLLI